MAIEPLYNEGKLFQRIAAGDEQAFSLFFDRHKDRLFRFMLRICKSGPTAEELTHDVFMKIWTNRYSLPGVDQPKAYIFTLAKNTAIDHLRKIASERRLLDQLWLDLNEARNATQETMDAEESGRLIREAVERLSPQKRLVFRLSRDAGMKHEKIASSLNISKSTVNNHLVQSIKAIKQYLRNHHLF